MNATVIISPSGWPPNWQHRPSAIRAVSLSPCPAQVAHEGTEPTAHTTPTQLPTPNLVTVSASWRPRHAPWTRRCGEGSAAGPGTMTSQGSTSYRRFCFSCEARACGALSRPGRHVCRRERRHCAPQGLCATACSARVPGLPGASCQDAAAARRAAHTLPYPGKALCLLEVEVAQGSHRTAGRQAGRQAGRSGPRRRCPARSAGARSSSSAPPPTHASLCCWTCRAGRASARSPGVLLQFAAVQAAAAHGPAAGQAARRHAHLLLALLVHVHAELLPDLLLQHPLVALLLLRRWRRQPNPSAAEAGFAPIPCRSRRSPACRRTAPASAGP
jgi:hypothetical protein